MRNFDFKRYTPRPKKLLRASLNLPYRHLQEHYNLRSISNTRESVSSGFLKLIDIHKEKTKEITTVTCDIQTPRIGLRRGLKQQSAADFFLTDFEVLGYLTKHSFEFLIWPLKPFIILGEIQSKTSQNLMLKLRSAIKTTATVAIFSVFSF